MQTKRTRKPRRTDVQPHRLGMGWHFVWRYNPPMVHQGKREDGTTYEWEDVGETSEGCIMWLADQFARHTLGGATARILYRDAYRQRDGEAFDDEWLATDALRDEWDSHTVSPKRWGPTEVRQLLEDLEDVNYHSFSDRLTKLIEERAPQFSQVVHEWCGEAPNPATPTAEQCHGGVS